VPGAGASTTAAGAYTSPPTSPTVPTSPGTSPFPPSAPADLTAAVTTGSVTLRWTASTPGCCAIEGYDITYTQAFNDIVWGQQVGNVTSVTITANIARTKQYRFSVSARDTLGHRSPSSSVVVVIPNTDTGDTTPPSAPRDFAAVGQGGTTAQLSWSAATDDVGVTGYDVYKFDGLFVSTLLATVTGTSAGVPLGAGRNLFYVRARDAAGNLSIATGTVTVQGATNPPVTPGLCQVTYAKTSEWPTGFVATVTIRNTSPSTAISGWTLTFAFQGDQRVTHVWSAQATQDNAVVTARNADWNGTIPAGGSVSFGMYGAWSASNAPPTAFALNGTGCVGGT
jgi:hypothetical protein